MRVTKHTEIRVSSFQLDHDKNPRIQLTYLFKDMEGFPTDWTKSDISLTLKRIPIHVSQNKKKDLTDHVVLARKVCFAARLKIHPKRNQYSQSVKNSNMSTDFWKEN